MTVAFRELPSNRGGLSRRQNGNCSPEHQCRRQHSSNYWTIDTKLGQYIPGYRLVIQAG